MKATVNLLDGTTGGTAKVENNMPWTQIAFAGVDPQSALTGVVSVDFKSVGGHDFEPFDPVMTLDFAENYTAYVPSGGIEELRFNFTTPASQNVNVTALQTVYVA